MVECQNMKHDTAVISKYFAQYIMKITCKMCILMLAFHDDMQDGKGVLHTVCKQKPSHHATMWKCDQSNGMWAWLLPYRTEEECHTRKVSPLAIRYPICRKTRINRSKNINWILHLKFWVVVKSVTGVKWGLELMSQFRINWLSYSINALSQSNSAPTEKSGKC